MLLTSEEAKLRHEKVAEIMRAFGIDALIINDNPNLFYLTGRVFCGYALVVSDGTVRFYCRRPVRLMGENVVYIRKPEEMGEALKGYSVVGFMGDDISWGMCERLRAICPEVRTVNASNVMRQARAVKTVAEIRAMKTCGVMQTEVYRRIPALYREGMSDLELQIEIERTLRLEGCLGIFRTSGDGLELFMGNVLTGKNADTPSPYDFAMGGRGIDPSLPVGADGTIIKPGQPVMVDMNGNFNGYMTDMTRMYIAGEVPAEVDRAHRLSCEICRTIADSARPGVEAKSLYELALNMAREAGMAEFFMGRSQQAGFVGHGVGITVNELPVLAPRSKDILQEGHTIAVEPKFVIPGCGAVGIENTYVVGSQGPAQCITPCPEQIIGLL